MAHPYERGQRHALHSLRKFLLLSPEMLSGALGHTALAPHSAIAVVICGWCHLLCHAVLLPSQALA